MKRTNAYTIFTALAFAVAVVSCKKDENPPVEKPQNEDEQELITTFTLTFTDTSHVLPDVTATFRDNDGAGGNAPTTFDTIRLQNNTVYAASITLLNESVTPAEDITEEVHERDFEHLFCFDVSAGLDLSIIRTDSDGTYEVGLQSLWTCGNVSTGNTTIRLKHQPGVKNGQCDPGETDIELSFITEINN